MKVNKPSHVSSKNEVSKKNKAKSDTSFSLDQSVDNINSSGATVGNIAPVTHVDALLAIQSVNSVDVEGRKKKAVNYGNELLDTLDLVKKQIVLGKVSKKQLLMLKQLLSVQPDTTGYGKLDNVLNDILLRVKVELAKLKMI